MTISLPISKAEDLGRRALIRRGVTPANAAAIIRVYMEAELCGKPTHGLQLIPWVLRQLAETNPTEPKILRETEWSVLIDGAENPGPPVAESLVIKLLSKTENAPIAIGGIRNAGHVGILSYYVRKLTDLGRIGIVFATTPSVTVPHGGTEPALGTNPICIGVPAKDGPIIFDSSTTAITYHALLTAKRDGTPLPPNVVLDTSGNPTQDAASADPARLLPFGDHRGFGLSFMIEILTGALSGWKVGAEKARDIRNDRFSTTMISIRSDVFVDKQEVFACIDRLSKDVAQSQGLPTPRIPSSHSSDIRRKTLQSGTIHISKELLSALEDIATQ